ncbi:MAG: thioredoxin domain-containing protein [Planctomycetota bacterium]|jgi:thioredoxin 1
MLNFDRLENKYKKDEKPKNEIKVQEHTVKKNNKCLLYTAILIFAVVIMGSISYYFWPKIKSLPSITKAAVALNKDVSLTGIFYTKDDPDPMAIVNGKIVHEQDVIDGVKVLKIHQDKVEFEMGNRTWSQSMPTSQESAGSGLPVLLELGSHKCPPCRQMAPILNELRDEYSEKFEIRYIDVWKDRAAGAKYGVRAIPTQIFFDSKGREVFRHVGFYPKKDILATWKNIGVKL